MSKPAGGARSRPPNRRPFPADVSDSADDGRPCEECGHGLGQVHGNRRYHPACGSVVRSRSATEHSAQYRTRKRSTRPSGQPDAVVPPGHTTERIAVRGVALPGERVLELRAAMHAFVLGLIEQDRYLRQFTTRQIRLSQDRLALRAFVDEGFHLVALIDDFMPIVRVHGAHDLLTLVKATVTEAHAGCCP